MGLPKEQKNTVSRQIYIPKKLDGEIRRIQIDINEFEEIELDLREMSVELIALGVEVKKKQLEELKK